MVKKFGRLVRCVERGKPISMADAAVFVLLANDSRPMHYKEIAKAIDSTFKQVGRYKYVLPQFCQP